MNINNFVSNPYFKNTTFKANKDEIKLENAIKQGDALALEHHVADMRKRGINPDKLTASNGLFFEDYIYKKPNNVLENAMKQSKKQQLGYPLGYYDVKKIETKPAKIESIELEDLNPADDLAEEILEGDTVESLEKINELKNSGEDLTQLQTSNGETIAEIAERESNFEILEAVKEQI